MSGFKLPPIDAVIDRHSELIDEFGGPHGIRDRGALDSALARAANLLAYGTDPTIAAMAATIAFGICQNHPFVDGNKRATFDTLGTVLLMNDLWLDVSDRNAIRTILALAAGEIDEEPFSQWVTANVVPLAMIQTSTDR